MVDKRTLYPLLALVLLGVLVGIGVNAMNNTPGPEAATETPEGSEDGHGPLQEASIKTYPEFHNEEGNNTLPVTVDIDLKGHPEFTYKDVQLCLYDSEGQVLDQRTIESIRSPEDGEFDESYRLITRPAELPTYIVVDHPRLRNDSRFHVELRYRENGENHLTHKSLDEIQDDFEWPRTNETGECG